MHSEGEIGKKERKMPIREEEFQVSQLREGSHVRLVNNMGEGRASEDQHFLLLAGVLITLTLPLFPSCDRKETLFKHPLLILNFILDYNRKGIEKF